MTGRYLKLRRDDHGIIVRDVSKYPEKIFPKRWESDVTTNEMNDNVVAMSHEIRYGIYNYIVDGVKREIKVRFAYMIANPKKAIDSISYSKGRNWVIRAYNVLRIHGGDYDLNETYGSTLFDDNTILVYHRLGNKEEPIEQEPVTWDEDDFVKSQQPAWK